MLSRLFPFDYFSFFSFFLSIKIVAEDILTINKAIGSEREHTKNFINTNMKTLRHITVNLPHQTMWYFKAH